jgi:hypothetical protein
MSELIQYIKDKLSIKNVGPQILERTNTLIEEAIWELKRSEVIPPVELNFVSLDKKEERRDNKGKVRYNFYQLPADFHSLEEFFVNDTTDAPERRIPYQYQQYANYIDLAKTNDQRKYFSITDITIDGENRKVLIANPFPDDDVLVSIKYFEDGTEAIASRIDKRYWKIILREIEGELNLRHPQLVEEERSLEISRSKNQKGKNGANATMGKVRGTFFKGKTGRGSNYNKKSYN